MAVTATGFITDAVLMTALKDTLQRAQGAAGTGIGGKGAAGDLLPFWSSIVTRANAAAYQEIIARLAERGFDLTTQIQQWDRGVEFQTAIGLWWCLTTAAQQAPDSYSPWELKAEAKQLDRRWELKDCAVMVGGKWNYPNTNVGQANTGKTDLLCGYDPGRGHEDDWEWGE